MITDRVQKFFISAVSWLLLKTMANQSPKTRISRPTGQRSEKSCLRRIARKTKILVLDLLPTTNETKAATLSAWRLHCCSRDRRSRSAVSDRGCKNQLL